MSVPMADASCDYVGITHNKASECTRFANPMCQCGSSGYDAGQCNEDSASASRELKIVRTSGIYAMRMLGRHIRELRDQATVSGC